MSDHVSLFDLPPRVQHVLDAGLVAGFTATVLGYLPTATAVLIFIYYALQIALMVRKLRDKKAPRNRRKTDGIET